MHFFWSESLNPIAEFVSDPPTIKTRPQAHKPADSGVAVGKGARLRSLKECLLVLLKQWRLRHRQLLPSVRRNRLTVERQAS